MDRIRASAISQAFLAVNFARPCVGRLTPSGAWRRVCARLRVARRLLPEATAMWFLLDRGLAEGDGAEEVLPALEAIAQFAEELRHRLAGDGVDGIDGAFALYRRLRSTLDGIPQARVEEMRAEIARLERWLGDALRFLEDLRRLQQGRVCSAAHG